MANNVVISGFKLSGKGGEASDAKEETAQDEQSVWKVKL